MKKVSLILLALIMMASIIVGCGGKYEAVDVKITAIAGPTGVGLVDLMQKQDEGEAANNYSFDVVTAPDQAVAAVVNGTADIAAIPTNLASTLYKKTNGNVQVLALNTLGVLHILTNGEKVDKVFDLKGKTIYTSGQGANPEYILRYVLEQNGVDPDNDVTIEFVADNDTLGALVANGIAKVALVPEPKASAVMMQNKDVKRALNMTEEWEKVNKSGIPLTMGCVVARKEFVQNNPEAVRMFLREYRASIYNVADNAEVAATLCETYGIIPKAAIAKAAIPNCGLTFVEGATMQMQLSGYLNILNNYNPKAIGGSLPDKDFYYVP